MTHLLSGPQCVRTMGARNARRSLPGLLAPATLGAAAAVALVALMLIFAAHGAAAETALPAPIDVNIVAHQDDDILFMNPDILNSVAAGHRQVTVFLTGGNLRPDDYWYSRDRENGAMDGYAKMLQIVKADSAGAFTSADPCAAFGPPLTDNPGRVGWLQGPLQFGPYTVQTASTTDLSVQLIFVRIDASRSENGSPVEFDLQQVDQGTKFANLSMLWRGVAPVAYTSDGRTSYSRAQLVNLLQLILQKLQPTIVRTQDSLNPFPVDGPNAFQDGFEPFYDHSDHYHGALFAREALKSAQLPASTNYISYNGYNIDYGIDYPPVYGNGVKPYTLTSKESCFKKTIMYYYTMNDQAISRAYQQSFPGFAFLGYPPANQPPFTESWLTHQLGIKLPLP